MTISSPPQVPAPTEVPFLDLRAAALELADELDAATRRVVASGWYLLGHELAAFEREFAGYIGTQFCIGVANGLDALTLVLRAWNVGPGDEVIVPSNTYVATWLAISAVGATIVPVEPDEDTAVIGPAGVHAALTERTRVVLPVHLYGLISDLSPLGDTLQRRGIRVLEDAAQAHGASVNGRRAGALGDAAAWSFYPTKNLGALGDAGAVTTSDPDLADRLRVLRNYGSRMKYVNEVRGINSRLDEIHAAVLRVKLRVLDTWNARRARLAAAYNAECDRHKIRRLRTPAGHLPAWHLYVVRVPDRGRVRDRMREAGIETLVHYPTPPHLQGAYGDLGWTRGRFPVAERLHDEVLSLPMGPHMREDAPARVISELARALGS